MSKKKQSTLSSWFKQTPSLSVSDEQVSQSEQTSVNSAAVTPTATSASQTTLTEQSEQSSTAVTPTVTSASQSETMLTEQSEQSSAAVTPTVTSTPQLKVDKPNQPVSYNFPKRLFGKDNRCFKSEWFTQFPWLHYNEELDSAFCFVCMEGVKKKVISAGRFSRSIDSVFVKTGFCNWKHAIGTGKGFQQHQSSACHKEALERCFTVCDQVKGDIDYLFASPKVIEEQKKNRKCLSTIVENIRFLARQTLPSRGNWKKEVGCEEDSNFHQLNLLRSQDNPAMAAWLKRKGDTYTSPEIQNEILEIMALKILRRIRSNIKHAKIYSVMADETADVSNTEQLVICIRWVDDQLGVHEEFIGLHSIMGTDADQIVAVIKDVLLRLDLNVVDARGQCYDGAASMMGCRSGVATQLKRINPKMLVVHCYGHALNLAIGDMIKNVQPLKNTLDTAQEICKLVKKSPKRNAKIDQLREETKNSYKGIHALCPTRWTIRGEALASFSNNHGELMDWSLVELSARIAGVKAQMATFEFFFCSLLGEKIMKQTDNLSRALQDPSISAAQGYALAQLVLKSLKQCRNEESVNLFWEFVLKRRDGVDVAEPVLPRRRKAPKNLESCWGYGPSGTNHHPGTAKELYRSVYYQAYDNVIASITGRFEQPDFKKYIHLQELLFKAVRGESYHKELDAVRETYGDDLDYRGLEGQLELLPFIFSSTKWNQSSDVKQLTECVRKLSNLEMLLIAEVIYDCSYCLLLLLNT